MRCQDVRKILEEGSHGNRQVEEHLRGCPGCAEVAGDWQILRSGFKALRLEEPPPASWGFAERLLRRLGAAAERPSEELMELAGRRIVYATLLITLLALLGLVVPSSGPLRAGRTAEVLVARPEIAAAGQEAPIGLGYLESVPSAWPGKAAAGGQPQK
jgi:hypothetical protein